MCRRATKRRGRVVRFSFLVSCFSLCAVSLLVSSVWAQTPSLDWRHIGNSAIELGLPSVATGPVNRVWYSGDGAVLYARTKSGKIFQTNDFEQWHRVTDKQVAPPAESDIPALTMPE